MAPARTYTFKGERVTRGDTSGGSKKRLTVLLCCSASGRKLPPLLVFKGAQDGQLARKYDLDGDGYPPGVIVAYQPSAWCDGAVMSTFATKMYAHCYAPVARWLMRSSRTASLTCAL